MATTQEGNVSFQQIRMDHRLGDGAEAQSCDGTFTAGNLPQYGSDGRTGDSGIPASSVALISKVQQEAYVYAADTGAANAYAVVLSPAPTITAGSEVVFLAAHTNTGASTLAVNGGTAAPITKTGTTALAAGDIVAGQIVTAKYDGANWQIVAAGSSGTTATRQSAIAFDTQGQVLSAGQTSTFGIPGNLSSFQIPGNFGGAVAGGTNPTATAVITFYKNATAFGTLSISTSGTFTWSTTSGAVVSFKPGTDKLSWTGPSPADATLTLWFGIPVLIS